MKICLTIAIHAVSTSTHSTESHGKNRFSSLYHQLTLAPEAPVGLHRIRSDQMYHHYQGAPLEVLLLYADGRSEVTLVGQDLTEGMRPQLFIPGGTFHTARVGASDAYALLATSVWVRAEPSDVEMGDADALMKSFPAAQARIAEFVVPT